MAWTWEGRQLSRSIERLGKDFDSAFPDRDHASDGAKGNAEHAARTSAHNPDDTPGAKPESNDTDVKPEVRGIDVDKDLHSKWTMQQVVNFILNTSEDRKRLLYIIYDSFIWSKSRGWARTAYTGSNPHDKHAHFSGDPLYDEDTTPWCVSKMGVIVTDPFDVKRKHGDNKEFTRGIELDNIAEVLRRGGWKDWWIATKIEAIAADTKAIRAELDSTPELDYAKLASALLDEMTKRAKGDAV